MGPLLETVRLWVTGGGTESPFDTWTLLRESAPIAVILLFWGVLAQIELSTVSNGLLVAGLIMAGMYAVVRGVALGRTIEVTATPDSTQAILRENVQVVLLAGGWFLAAVLLRELPQVLITFVYGDFLHGLVTPFVFATAGAGVGAVLLYAIAIGGSRVRATARYTDTASGLAAADD